MTSAAAFFYALPSSPPSIPAEPAHIERTRFERRDERTEQFLADVDRRQGPRRFAEVEAERVADIECGGSGRVTVAERNPALHPLFAGIFQGCGL